MDRMSLFWIVGIVLNVVLTGLAIWWVVRQMRRREDPPRDDRGPK
jgi:heme/copper-type cytochrome/quinol oxidase subunit 4